jgi:hypothetical protein
MNFLPPLAFQEIDNFDWLHYRVHGLLNRTRFYKYLLPAGKDVEVHTVAVRARKDGSACVKEVIRASVDDPQFYVKDVGFMTLAGYVVDWSPDGLGDPKPFNYRGKWEAETYQRQSGMWKLRCSVINPDALILSGPRFRWCAWDEDTCGDILDYLKDYAKHPRIELLSKAGAGRFASKVGFVRAMESDKAFMRFFMTNLEEIQKLHYGVDVIRLAYKRGENLKEAAHRIEVKSHFRGYGLPAHVDAIKVDQYLRERATGKDPFDYCNYMKDCAALGFDMKDTKVLFPNQFARRAKTASDMVKEIMMRKQAELIKKQDSEIAAVACRFARLEKARGAFAVRIPRQAADLVREGDKLDHCVGQNGYAAKMARGETIIAFIRLAEKPTVPFFTLEWDPAGKRILQLYGKKHAAPPKPVSDFVNRVFLKKAAAA